MRRFWCVVLTVLVTLPMLAATAGAWEFGLKGHFIFEFDYLSQTKEGFFGPHDVDATAGGGQEQINFWPGLRAPVNPNTTVSGLDAGWHTQWAELKPKIKINKALSWESLVYLGRWNPNNGDGTGGRNATAIARISQSEYSNSFQRGVWRSITPFYVNYWRVKIALPWGNLSMGKRPSSFGIGLFNSGKHGILKTSNTSSESISLTAPYGPISIGISFYPNRRGGEGYYNDDDRTNIRWANFAWGASYKCGPLVTGFAIGHAYRHRGGERTIGNAGNSRDRADLDAGVYFKYFNGRFFLNAEYRYYERIDVLTGRARNYFDQELRAWAVEGGAIAGPSKVSVLVANVSGPDRRALDIASGSAIFKTNTIGTITQNYSNTSLFLPYSYLMVYTYGTGLPGNGQDGGGFLDAAQFYGARVDYNVAANMDVYFTFCQALRPYKGYGWGYIRPDNQGVIGYGQLNNGAVRSPAIPDDNLGWEVGTGVYWKWLEGLTLYSRVAYWQPGAWYNFACVSKSNPLWLNPATDVVLWGTNPNRNIDPIVGGYAMMALEF